MFTGPLSRRNDGTGGLSRRRGDRGHGEDGTLVSPFMEAAETTWFAICRHSREGGP